MTSIYTPPSHLLRKYTNVTDNTKKLITQFFNIQARSTKKKPVFNEADTKTIIDIFAEDGSGVLPRISRITNINNLNKDTLIKLFAGNGEQIYNIAKQNPQGFMDTIDYIKNIKQRPTEELEHIANTYKIYLNSKNTKYPISWAETKAKLLEVSEYTTPETVASIPSSPA